MKKLLIFLFLISALSCGSKSDSVYICTGPYAKAYHNDSECRGILACKADIETVSINKAEDMERTPCSYCY